MRKEIIMIYFFILCFKSFSQSFNEREIKRINYFGINTIEYDLNDNKIYTDFFEILKLNNKGKSNKTFGIVLGSVALLTTSFGILALSAKKDDGMGKAIVDTIGGFSLGVEVISGGVSIKLFNSSRKRERDKLIKLYE
tara:strand:+ start:65 stop:478 length:414 start_codon:yes stop_codon:yes gene_type:complete